MLKIHKDIDFIRIGLSVFSQQEVIVVQSLVEIEHLKPGVSLLQCKLAPIPLRAGSYPIQIRVHDKYNSCLAVIDRKDFLLRIGKQEGWDEQSQRTSATSIIDLESIWTDPVEISKGSYA